MESPRLNLEALSRPENRRLIIVKIFNERSSDKFQILGLLLPFGGATFQDLERNAKAVFDIDQGSEMYLEFPCFFRKDESFLKDLD